MLCLSESQAGSFRMLPARRSSLKAKVGEQLGEKAFCKPASNTVCWLGAASWCGRAGKCLLSKSGCPKPGESLWNPWTKVPSEGVEGFME